MALIQKALEVGLKNSTLPTFYIAKEGVQGGWIGFILHGIPLVPSPFNFAIDKELSV